MALRVMRLGDSLTVGLAYWGGMAKDFGSDVEWVGTQKTGDGPHEGHGGWSIHQISMNLGAWLAESKPDITTLMIGTNDAAGNRPPEAMLADLEALVRQIAKQSKVVVSTIPPYPAKAKIQTAYNDGIRKMVPRLAWSGLAVKLADPPLSESDLLPDRIHLQQTGSQKVAKAFGDQIRSFSRSWVKWATIAMVAAAGTAVLFADEAVLLWLSLRKKG